MRPSAAIMRLVSSRSFSRELLIMRDEPFLIRNDLRDLPKIAEEIGHLNVAWAHVELRVFFLFWLLTGAQMPVARAIFYSLRTTHARLEMVQAIAPLIFRRKRGRGTTAELRKLRKLLGSVAQISGERNKYVHDAWGSPKGKHRAVQARLTGKDVEGHFSSVTRQEIARLTNKLKRKAAVIARFYIALRPKIPALLERLGKPQSLALVRATKDIRPKRPKAKPRPRHQPSRASP